MKIGINLIALGAENGTGAFRYIKMLLCKMGDFDILDCKFTIYKQKQISDSYLDVPSSLNVDYVDVPTLGEGAKRIIFEQTLFYFYIRKCDVFYSYCTSMPLWVDAKRIFTLHDVYFMEFPKRYSLFKSLFLKTITKLYVKRVDKILTVSVYSKNSIIKYFKVNPENIVITYNFIINKSEKCKKNIDKMISVDHKELNLNTKFFLYIGSLQPGKNISGLLEGFVKFHKKKTEFSLVIVGKPCYKGEAIVNQCICKDNVYYLGYLSRDMVEILLQKCYAVALLSFCEGFGIPPLEGFFYNKPALVSNSTSLPEVVGEAGVKVNPYSVNDISLGFMEIVNNRELYVNNIEKQILKFDASKATMQFLEALDINYK